MNMVWAESVQGMELKGVLNMDRTFATMIACGIFSLMLGVPSVGWAADPTNTNLGDGSLQNVTSGNLNTALGYLSLNADTSGYNNTATGAFSMRNNTTGLSNTATGGASLFANTTGIVNTATGSS